jgi:hypothetical protein
LTDGNSCNATADSTSSGAIGIGGNPAINYQLWVYNASNYNGGIQPLFLVNYGTPPSSLVVILYATSGGQEGVLNSSSNPGSSSIEYDSGTHPKYGCSVTSNQEETTPFLSSTHYNDVYILACTNIPNDGTGIWAAPELMVGSQTSFSYAVYVFNPDATYTFNN